MNAQVREGAPNKVCTAFGGSEFVWYEWRAVPSGFEHAARGHGYLEVDDVDPDVPVVEVGEIVHPVLAVDIEDMTIKDLRAFAKGQGVAYSGLNKADLVAALRDD